MPYVDVALPTLRLMFAMPPDPSRQRPVDGGTWFRARCPQRRKKKNMFGAQRIPTNMGKNTPDMEIVYLPIFGRYLG